MACAYAKYTGKLGACVATSGPGAIHLLNGLYDAKADNTPVIAITGTTYSDLMNSNYQQDVNLLQLYSDLAIAAEPTWSVVINLEAEEMEKQANLLLALLLRNVLKHCCCQHLQGLLATRLLDKESLNTFYYILYCNGRYENCKNSSNYHSTTLSKQSVNRVYGLQDPVGDANYNRYR